MWTLSASRSSLAPAGWLNKRFGNYHSKTEINGRLLRYTRTVEIRNLSLPADRADDLKQFYRAISGDERNSVILKRASR